MNDTMISLDNVSLTLPGPAGDDVHILHEITAKVQRAETVSIIGPSGSGKTSLMMLIAGVEKSSGGKLVVAGSDITHFDEDQLAEFRRKHVSIVFQNFHLIPTMTALENVALALDFAGVPGSTKQASQHLNAVGLSKRLQHYPQQLSGGEQQRVALARAFATEPDLLLADEPTGNLDSENSKLTMQLLFDLQKQHGTTLVLITHDNDLAGQTSRRLVMKDGKLRDA